VFVELIDVLRCTRPHEESWLVAVPTRMDGRHIAEGVLGCPVCQAEYPVRRGVVDFTGEVDPSAGPPSASSADPEVTDAMRLAALLDLTDDKGWVLLTGRWTRLVDELQSIVENELLVVNPPAEREGGDGVSVIRVGNVLPLASGLARAAAIDLSTGVDANAAAAVVRSGGRVMGPSELAVPAGVRELARDDAGWVGEREGNVSAPVLLRVRGRAE
jgi:hypothetical protein